MATSSSTKLFQLLEKLSHRPINNPYNKLAVQELLQKAFDNDKPLFHSDEKPQATVLMIDSIPILEKAFEEIHGSMNTDLRQSAQIWRSGLQFLIDELKNDETFNIKLKQILQSDPVQCVEDFISDSKDIATEYVNFRKINQEKIPKEHFWWP